MTFLKKILYSVLHGILLILLAFFAANISYTFEMETYQVKNISFFYGLFKKYTDYSNRFLFIDVSATKTLIANKEGTGDEVITDLRKINRLFSLINSQEKVLHKDIFCDIIFDRYAPYTDSLGITLGKVKGLLIPFSQDEDSLIMPLYPGIPKGYAGYPVSAGLSSSDKLVKYTLLPERSLPTVPLMLYSKENAVKPVYTAGLIWINGEPYLNNVVPVSRLSMESLTDSSHDKILPLNQILDLLEANDSLFYPLFFKDKTVIIGDFRNDVHDTYAGRQPGPLIITNAFLAFSEKDNKITAGWLLYLLITLSVTSFLILYPPGFLEKAEGWLKKYPLGLLLVELSSITFLLITVSFSSFCFFHKHLDITIIIFYLTVLACRNSFNKKIK